MPWIFILSARILDFQTLTLTKNLLTLQSPLRLTLHNEGIHAP
jgi:hypothetical protein